jgi:hypothetical protein
VNDYVNHHVAHSKATRTRKDLTIEQLDVAVDTIGDLFTKYASLLTAKGWALLVPVAQYDWLAPFRVPWIKPQ